MLTEHYSYFSHRECEYFPCHPGADPENFNCLFCYCPLYALGDRYGRDTILKWLRSFYRRFFTQQFKRSCLPDGPKVGSVTLSPRGDWRMPSDAVAALWMEELEGL